MITTDESYMREALVLAQTAAASGEVPVGAVLVKGEEIVGRGWNRPIGARDPSAHAEILALRDAATRLDNYRLPGTTLYVTIEPCAMCAGAMIHARVERLVFGAPEPKSGVAQSNEQLFDKPYFNHRLEVVGGVLGDDCSALISAFFQTRRQQR